MEGKTRNARETPVRKPDKAMRSFSRGSKAAADFVQAYLKHARRA